MISLNVQLQEELSKDECEAVLRELDLPVQTKLEFAPDLYEVVAVGREDPLAASVELHDDDRFTLAEPTFIEHIPGRLKPSDPRYLELRSPLPRTVAMERHGRERRCGECRRERRGS